MIKLVFVVLPLIFVSCTKKSSQVPTDPVSQGKKVRILFQGDQVGQAVPCSCFRAPFGGLARQKNGLDKFRADSSYETIYVDAGNLIGQTDRRPPNAQQVKRAEKFWSLVQNLEIDILAPGLTDYNFGLSFLTQNFKNSKTRFVSSNVLNAKTGKEAFEPFIVKSIGGVKWGFLSVTPENFSDNKPVSSRKAMGIKIVPYKTVLQKQIDRLRTDEKVEMVVVLSQLKIAEAEALAEEFKGISLVVNTDSTFGTDKPFWFPGKTLLVDPGYQGAYLGKLDIDLEMPFKGYFSLSEQMKNNTEIDKLKKQIASGDKKPTLKSRLELVQTKRLTKYEPGMTRYEFELVPLTEKDFGTKNSLTDPAIALGI